MKIRLSCWLGRRCGSRLCERTVDDREGARTVRDRQPGWRPGRARSSAVPLALRSALRFNPERADHLGGARGAPSVVVRERIVVGERPPPVGCGAVPEYPNYRYAVVNEQRVIVEPRTARSSTSSPKKTGDDRLRMAPPGAGHFACAESQNCDASSACHGVAR